MAFRAPTFNTTVNIWRSTTPITNPPDDITLCNLRGPGRAHGSLSGDPLLVLLMEVLLPALTDIRDGYSPGGKDRVEIPAGTGRYYEVFYVDDVAKGFPNEYRFAIVEKLVPWPAPIP